MCIKALFINPNIYTHYLMQCKLAIGTAGGCTGHSHSHRAAGGTAAAAAACSAGCTPVAAAPACWEGRRPTPLVAGGTGCQQGEEERLSRSLRTGHTEHS